MKLARGVNRKMAISAAIAAAGCLPAAVAPAAAAVCRVRHRAREAVIGPVRGMSALDGRDECPRRAIGLGPDADLGRQG